MFNMLTTSILVKTDVENVFIALVVVKTDVVNTLSTSVLDQPMFFCIFFNILSIFIMNQP